jgi:uncharacterized damage-inducible protein DinB
MRHLLIDPIIHIPPARALEGLTTADAERRLDGANHAIADILAHLIFWQSWFSDRCDGIAQPMAASASQGWPAVPRGSWPDLHQTFLDGLERVAAFGDDERRANARIEPPIEFPPLARYTIREALVHVAQHNAHHLGQIILLRQLMGAWPPPSGSWTW